MKYLSLFAVVILIFWGCQKSAEQDPDAIVIPPPTPEFIKTSVQGKVLNENGEPVAGSTVTFGKATTTTDEHGIFRLMDADIDIHATVVKVNKSGYFNAFRTFMASKDNLNFVRITLIPHNTAGKFSATSGGSVTIPNGGSLIFPAASVVKAAGNTPFAGQVLVSAHFIDPTAPELAEIMPGDLRGINRNGQEKVLQSYGMVAVDLTSESGEKLQLAPGKTAQVKLPIPGSLLSGSPATIPLWSFDEVRGLWKEEGTATKKGTNYECEVKHFSFWNYDVPSSFVQFEATIKTNTGQALFNTKVKISRIDKLGSTFGFTDSTGHVEGAVPNNQELEMSVYNECNEVIFTRNIGPFTENSNFGAITVVLNAPIRLVISGKAINCLGNPVASGQAFIKLGDYYHSTMVTNGGFSILIDRCSPGDIQASISVVDFATSQESAASTTELSSGVYDAGTFEACTGGVTNPEFWTMILDGKRYDVTNNETDSVSCLWSSNLNLIGISQSPPKPQLGLSASINASTTGAFNFLTFEISTGTDNYNVTNSVVPVTISEYGGTGKYIAGSFAGSVRNLRDSAAIIVPVSGSFRLKIK